MLCPKGYFISYLKVIKIIFKGCIYCVVQVRDSSVENLSLKFNPVVNKFLKVFPYDLFRVSSNRGRDFGINFILDTQSISIPLYRMVHSILKEVKK